MPTFTLRYKDDGLGLDKRVEFDATSPAVALGVASAEREGRRAILLADGEPLCELARESEGYWRIAGASCTGGWVTAPSFGRQE
ncbi:hypothetical protein GGC65_001378 [Sphingopyxis sp. OAS728]|uniref:hypothetical protein n=1 Tax=Sphingopyxis sp. OAS728 TaxID=2663823 RepID=UPI00178A3890|nr:hypothetical protein [Sphingopyxis sp. OAS728]MBE1526922.1 hypothetical protein [Sphingopyxis sp. OAS728]